MDKMRRDAIELCCIDAIREINRIQAIYCSCCEYDKSKKLDDIIHEISKVRFDNYENIRA